jgi:IMP dehydrogenase
MRDMVEIGMGRTARRTYELAEINIVPARRTRSSQDVSTAWQLDAYRFEIPVVAHPTDAVVSPEFAIELGRRGGLGVLNGEGLIGRHADVEARIAEVISLAEPGYTDAIEFEDMVSVGVGEKNLFQREFVPSQCGEEGVGIGSSIESNSLEGFRIPDEIVIHGHIGERGSEF